VQAGTYRDRVTVQVGTRTPTAAGTSTTWVDEREVWARVVPLSVEARAALGSLRGVVTHRVLLPGRADLTFGRHRLRHGGRTLELQEPPQFLEGVTVAIVKEAA
jgi:head-tail adaptor